MSNDFNNQKAHLNDDQLAKLEKKNYFNNDDLKFGTLESYRRTESFVLKNNHKKIEFEQALLFVNGQKNRGMETTKMQRQKELERLKIERDKKFRLNEKVKIDREQMMEHVSAIIMKHILSAEIYISQASQGAQLFNENN